MRSLARTLTLISMLALAPARTAAQAPAEAGDGPARVLARVNGEALYVEDVESLLGEIHRRGDAVDRSAFGSEQLLFRLVNDTLLAQEARALGLEEEAAIRDKIASTRADRARERLYREEIASRIEFSDELLRPIYDEVYRTATLLILSRREEAEADDLREALLAAESGEAIAALARERSQDPYAARRGRMEVVPLVDLYQTILDFATTARAGEVSPPLVTPYGWSVLRLEELAPADPALYSRRRGKCAAVHRYRRERELRGELRERLAGRFPIAVDETGVARIEIRRMHDGRLVPEVGDPGAVVARVGERELRAVRLGEALATAWQNVGNPRVAEAIAGEVLDDELFGQLLVAEAERRGYSTAPELERQLHALETRLLVNRVLQDLVSAGADVSPESMRSYYDEHGSEFRRPPRLHVLQITVGGEEEANRILDLARTGADFAWLARQHSTDAFRGAGGDRGWMPASSGLPLFKEELKRAVAGGLFGPKPWDGQWVVAKVDLVEDQGVFAYEEVAGNVRARLADRELDRRLDETIRTLRERSEIWIDEAAVAALDLAAIAAAPQGHAAH